MGLLEGDVIAILLRNSAAYVDIIHACRIGGFYYCPLNWHLLADEVRFILQDSGSRGLIGHGDLIDAVGAGLAADFSVWNVGPTARSSSIAYEDWLADRPSYAGPHVSPRAHMAYTSGTTGRPKGVVRAPVPLASLPEAQKRIQQVMEAACGIRPGARVLIPAPLYHSAVSLMMQHALLRAAFVCLHERFDAEAVLAAIAAQRIDTVYLVPIMYVRLLALPVEVRARYALSSLRFVASTGAPCAAELKAAMIAWFGPIVHESYASTECGLVTEIGSEEALARPGSAGRALFDAAVRIFSEDGQPCAPGENGLIYCRQPAWPDFTYRGLPDARAAVERDGLISLGDVGYLDRDGYLFVCDRASDLVISGGVNIYPAEIEAQLILFEGIMDCAVFGVPDPEFGERLHAVVETAGNTEVHAQELIDWLKTRLASFKVPRTIEFRGLPRDENGKIAKRLLRQEYWDGLERRV